MEKAEARLTFFYYWHFLAFHYPLAMICIHLVINTNKQTYKQKTNVVNNNQCVQSFNCDSQIGL
jgi:hypothetical protein